MRGLLVAAGAAELAVRAGERETCLLGVIELPDAPTVRRMALSAVFAQTAFVYVVSSMTTVAIRGDALVGAAHVTLRARHGYVQTHQGKATQVVIEGDIDTPAFRLMALLALNAEFSAVHVLCAVAVVALPAKFLLRNVGGVAAMAIDVDVFAGESELRVAIVIEAARFPRRAVVALFAIRAQSAGMIVFAAMTAVAVFGNFVLHAPGLVTRQAIDVGVNALQRETGLFEVIELHGFPRRCAVTLAAVGAASAAMRIVRCVAGYALFRRAFVAIAEVAARARRFVVRIAQRERGFAVIEIHFGPGSFVVARTAVLAQSACVRLDLAMTIVAGVRRLAIFPVGLMTAFASEQRMLPFERKIGALVTKHRFA